MAQMIIGYKRLKHCEAGSLIRTKDGSFVMLSEYMGNDNVFSGYIFESGENFCPKDPNEWVAIICLGQLEADISEELEYPNA